MPVDIDARLDDPHATVEQKKFNQAVKDHGLAMDRAVAAEVTQYQENERALALFGVDIKPKLTAAQQTAMGLRVGGKAAEALSVPNETTGVTVLQMLFANVTTLADATGQAAQQVWDAAEAAGLPADFQARRAAIANAQPTDAPGP